MASPQLPNRTVAKVLGHVLQSADAVSRSDLVEASGFTSATITRAVNPLIGRLLQEEAELSPEGRARKVLRMRPGAVTLAGISYIPRADFSETRVVGRLFDAAADEGSQPEDPVWEIQVDGTDQSSLVEATATIVTRMAEQQRVDAVGIELGGHVDGRAGVVRHSDNLRWFDEVPLASLVTQAVGLPVCVENDANCLALYERMYGLARGRSWFAVVIVGGGVGAGIYGADGLVYGSTGSTGELGHIPSVRGAEAVTCRCGRLGCLESVVGEAPLLTAAGGHDGPVPDLATAISLATEDPSSAAGTALVRAGEILGGGLATLVNVMDLDQIILAHDGLLDHEPTMEQLRAAFSKHSYRRPIIGTVELIPRRARVGDGARGAAVAALFQLIQTGEVVALG